MEQNLLAVTVSRADFEYDIHSLVKAFYPEREIGRASCRERVSHQV